MGLEEIVSKGVHAAEDAVSGAGHAVEEAAKGVGQAAGHIWHGEVKQVKDAVGGAVHAAGDVMHGVAQAGHDVAEGARHGDVLGGAARAGEDMLKDGGKALDHAWHGLTKGADDGLHGALDAVHDLGAGAGRAYDAGVKGASHAVADVAGRHAGQVVERAAEDAAKPVRAAADFAYGAGGAVAKGALGLASGTGDLVVGAVRVGTDAEVRDKLVAEAETLGKAVWNDPAGVARKAKDAAGHAWEGLKQDGRKAEQEGRGAEWWGDKIGGAAFQVGTFVAPFTKGAAAAKAAKALSEAEKGGEVLAGGAKAADAAKGMEAVAGDAAGAAPRAARAANRAGAAEPGAAGTAAEGARRPLPEARGLVDDARKAGRADGPAEPPPDGGVGAGAGGLARPAIIGSRSAEDAADGSREVHILRPGEADNPDGHVHVATEKLDTIKAEDAARLADLPPGQRPNLLKTMGEPRQGSGLYEFWFNKGVADDRPVVPNNAHKHEGWNSGTFDSSYDHMDFERNAELSDDGKEKSYIFPVAPVLFEPDAVPRTGGKIDGLDPPAYYVRQEPGQQGPRNLIGRAEIRGKYVIVPGHGLRNATGVPLLEAGTYPKRVFERLLGAKIPPGVEGLNFISTPDHASTFYPGVERDFDHVKLVADQIAARKASSPATARSYFVGLASSNPFDSKTKEDAFKVMAFTNRLETFDHLEAGDVKIAGFGELTIAKEANERLSHMRSLLGPDGEPDMDVIHDISHAIAPMRYAGGVTTIHMDAATSQAIIGLSKDVANITTFHTLDEQSRNLKALDALLTANPDQQFIWAHIGSAFSQSVPETYLKRVQELLDKHPNLKIDTSWEPTADMIAGRNKLLDPLNAGVNEGNVKTWAKLIADKRYSDRFLWGTDTIAASRKPGNADAAVLRYFRDIGLLDAIKEASKGEGADRGAYRKFMEENFVDTVEKSAENVKNFRLDPENRTWLDKVANREDHTPVPPNQMIRENGDWRLAPSSTLPHGGNRDTYVMPVNQTPSRGPAMEWKWDKRTKRYIAVAGSGHARSTFPLNQTTYRPRL